MRIASISFKLFFLVLLTVAKTRADSVACEQKENHMALLDIAKECISKARDLPPSCGHDWKDLSTNSSKCGSKAKMSAYLNIARILIDVAEGNYTNCGKVPEDGCKDPTKVVPLQKKSADCSEILKNGEKKSGRYTIWPRHESFKGKSLEVYCDMDTDGGGWTLLQRRGTFSKKVDFFRNWNDYKNGFGDLSEEFWIGNEKIFALTNQATCTLRFDLENVRREKRYAEYSSFFVEDEYAGYFLHYGSYKGTAGDSMAESQMMEFSTKDKIYVKANQGCPADKKSGWWFSARCGNSNPNGVNQPGTSTVSSIFWLDWIWYESLWRVEMKIRPEK